ncbi:MAG TPA: VOC family protein [Geminicoccus sp.]|jgi:hypothetical protein|uniref:VOC family protein n=1 Tax=Geminicoccus sp. TaxID=2024832 RepID=UPI002E301098|nr:VOC family protein [Geminicoccus sp.]HEX2528557.1 VOC family protein [Geminicoccus sp.]
MATNIFVNLPVKDLDKSIAYFRKLGFDFNPKFTDATATCMIVADGIYVMLLTEAKFREFTPKQICDTRTSTEMLLALSLDSRAEVDALAEAAVAAGGTTYSDPKDYGFMYQRAFQDLDGHSWELFHMDPSFTQG